MRRNAGSGLEVLSNHQRIHRIQISCVRYQIRLLACDAAATAPDRSINILKPQQFAQLQCWAAALVIGTFGAAIYKSTQSSSRREQFSRTAENNETRHMSWGARIYFPKIKESDQRNISSQYGHTTRGLIDIELNWIYWIELWHTVAYI